MTIARPLQDYRGLVKACQQRAEELAISRKELDRLAGLPDGYSGKLLGNGNGNAKKPKRMWPASLEAILGTLGLKILVIEDELATARTLARREPADRRQQRFGDAHWRNQKLLPKLTLVQSEPPPKKKPAPAMSSHLRVIQPKKRGSKYG